MILKHLTLFRKSCAIQTKIAFSTKLVFFLSVCICVIFFPFTSFPLYFCLRRGFFFSYSVIAFVAVVDVCHGEMLTGKRAHRQEVRKQLTQTKLMANSCTNASRGMLNQSIICSIRLLENVFFSSRPPWIFVSQSFDYFRSVRFFLLSLLCSRKCVYMCVLAAFYLLFFRLDSSLLVFFHTRANSIFPFLPMVFFVVNFDFDPLRFVFKMQTHV